MYLKTEIINSIIISFNPCQTHTHAQIRNKLRYKPIFFKLERKDVLASSTNRK